MPMSDEDAKRLRAAAIDKALNGNPEAALELAAIHDMVTGKKPKASDNSKKGGSNDNKKGDAKKGKK